MESQFQIVFENLVFWSSYWLDEILPIANFLLCHAFNSIVINRVLSHIRDVVQDKIESEVS